MVSRADVGSSSFFLGKARAGFTFIEVMIVVAVISLLASMAVYNLLRARLTANEAAVMGNQRTLIGALEMYRGSNGAYPDDWQGQLYETAEPDYGPPAFNLEMDDSELQGYLYTYAGQPGGCAGDCSGYTLSGIPATLGITGSRAFFVDQTGVIRHCRGAGPADVTDPPMHLAPIDC